MRGEAAARLGAGGGGARRGGRRSRRSTRRPTGRRRCPGRRRRTCCRSCSTWCWGGPRSRRATCPRRSTSWCRPATSRRRSSTPSRRSGGIRCARPSRAALLMDGQAERAEQQFFATLVENPDNAWAYWGLAEARAARGDPAGRGGGAGALRAGVARRRAADARAALICMRRPGPAVARPGRIVTRRRGIRPAWSAAAGRSCRRRSG